MRLYLDEDIAAARLTQLLARAGHDVETAVSAHKTGKSDAEQLLHSIQNSRTMFSYNYGDFEHLHQLVVGSQGRHAGIVVVRRENDPRKNMSPADMVRAVRNIETAHMHIPMDDQFFVLNHWQ